MRAVEIGLASQASAAACLVRSRPSANAFLAASPRFSIAALRSFAAGWAEKSVAPLVDLQCEDPLTGLATVPFLRTRLGQLYRDSAEGTCLVVAEPYRENGEVAGIEISEVADQVEELKVFEGASSGLVSDDDVAEAGEALEPGTSAALLIYENRWAGPFAAAVRRSGGQLVANGRIPVQAFLAALDAAEEAEAARAQS